MKKQKSSRRKSPRRVQSDHDTLFQNAFGHRSVVQAHLRHFLPEKDVELLDLDTLTLLTTSFVDEQLSKSIADMCWQCQLKQGGSVYITFLYEHKSDLPREPVHLQLLDYLRGIWRKDRAENRPLTFIIPIVVYHGRKQWKKRSFAHAFRGIPSRLLRFLPDFDYELTSTHHMAPELIAAKEELGILRSVLLALKFAFDKKRLAQNFWNILIFVEESGFDRQVGLALMTYIEHRLELTPEQFKQFYTQTIEQHTDMRQLSFAEQLMQESIEKGLNLGIEKGVNIGIEKGVNIGIEKGIEVKNREIVISLLTNTDWSDEKIALIASVEIEFVQQIREELNQAPA